MLRDASSTGEYQDNNLHIFSVINRCVDDFRFFNSEGSLGYVTQYFITLVIASTDDKI